jgi:methylthioribose-1-phosphate isomerase
MMRPLKRAAFFCSFGSTMNINGKHHRTIWVHPTDSKIIQTWDQRVFPHAVEVVDLRTVNDAAAAISNMTVRGAPLIGATAAYGIYLASLFCAEDQFQSQLEEAAEKLGKTRPTAVNLAWAINQQMHAIALIDNLDAVQAALLINANKIADDDVETCRQIGLHGLSLIEAISARKEGETVNILTHCNAGWLACIDWGTATSPIYQAHAKGISVHVWVDETRPRNQGAHLTAFELGQQGIPHTLIVDNAGGHLMQHGQVDLVLVGTDRTTRQGDVANKIGTYLKALAAHDNNVPFYVGLPSSTIDWDVNDGVKEIPIETRSDEEVKYIQGKGPNGIEKVLICPENTPAVNYGFDVTPARLVTGLITERGIAAPNEASLIALFPEKA